MGGGALHPIESSSEGNIGWGGGETSTPCMSSVQDLPNTNNFPQKLNHSNYRP